MKPGASLVGFVTSASPYVCPGCKTRLQQLYCADCAVQYEHVDGIPILLPPDPRLTGVRDIAAAYDKIYRDFPNVWEEREGRTAAFIAYFAALLGRFPGRRFLEIGCGEGQLLSAVPLPERFAVELSTQAIQVARARSDASLSVALAEHLPFPTDFFDVVVSVGVMQHFLDIAAATREIRRVLRPGGVYVVLTNVSFTLWERVSSKISQYVFPRPRPVQLARWVRAKWTAVGWPFPVLQPVQHEYTRRRARARLEESGLRVVDVITKQSHPDAPLSAPWVTIYITQK
jgi:SAM-dependent methyltransferase